jgi:hypothetical protein
MEETMTAASLAYLIMILAAYAVFMLVLGAVWLRSSAGHRKPAAKAEVTQAREPTSQGRGGRRAF